MPFFSHGSVRISAKTEYALRATIELASVSPETALTAHSIAARQQIPRRFLLNILADLRRVGLVDSRRGPNGGWRLSRPAETITIADVLRAVDGPLVDTSRWCDADGDNRTAATMNSLWVTVRTGIREILDHTTVADLASDAAPDSQNLGRAGQA